MTRARRQRQSPPAREPLLYAVAAQEALTAAKGERGRAFLSAASAGWTLHEIGYAVGLSASTVLRCIQRAERDSASE